MAKKAAYDAGSVQKLSGIQHIRTRLGMYIPNQETEGLHHILWEVIDNAVDEHLAGHCSRVRVQLDTKRNVVTVDDNGRGVPVDVHPQTGRPTIESIFTETLMGGKFGRILEGNGYEVLPRPSLRRCLLPMRGESPVTYLVNRIAMGRA